MASKSKKRYRKFVMLACLKKDIKEHEEWGGDCSPLDVRFTGVLPEASRIRFPINPRIAATPIKKDIA